MFRFLRNAGIFITIVAGGATIIANVLSYQRSCEPLGLTECFAQWRKWAQAKEDAEAAAERIRVKKEEQLNRDMQKRADDAERKRKQEEDLRRATAEEHLRKDLEEARINAMTKIAIEKAKLDTQLRELKEAEEKHKRDLEAVRIADQRKRLEEDERIAVHDAERRRKQLDDQRRRDEDDRRRQAELQRQQVLEKMRCGNTPNGTGYTCCPLGQTPDSRVNSAPPSSPGWTYHIGYCRHVDVR